jgi:hypothetical protein
VPLTACVTSPPEPPESVSVPVDGSTPVIVIVATPPVVPRGVGTTSAPVGAAGAT